MKKLFAILLTGVLALALFACDDKDKPNDPTSLVFAEDIGHWDGLNSNFARQGSSQYNNATLQAKEIDSGLALFEFGLMEGSEAEDHAVDLKIPGVLRIQEDLTGIYESIGEDGKTAFTILFSYAEDGRTITVTHTGEIPLNPDGVYEYADYGVECSEGTVRAFVENLPTNATSLSSNLSTYTLHYPEESVLGYFYPISATLDDTGAILVSFVVTSDLSAVYRTDTEDGIPMLIHGTAQDMLDRQIVLEGDDEEAELIGTLPALPVVIADGTFLAPGTKSKLVLASAWPFAISFEGLLSTDDSIAAVSESGEITALKEGSVTITGTLVVDDGKTNFMVGLAVGSEGGDVEATPGLEEAVG